jgi:UDP-3-O-[3-hydroxymyristoyl] glucosamine N-acyltransferase
MSQSTAAPQQHQSPRVRAEELAQIVQGQLVGNPEVILSTLAPIEAGGPGALTFIRSQNFAKFWGDSDCVAALVTNGVDVPDHNPDERALIFVDDADIAVVRILEMINPGISKPDKGAHEHAQVHPDATVDPSARIGPGCVVMAGAQIDADTVLMANVYVGSDTHIGSSCLLHPGVVVGDRCVMGNNCCVFANTVIGADGFGFLPGDSTRGAIKVPQIGSVEIGDEVEIGACSTIDRAKFGVTRVGNRTKIDNQVHVGHNCIIGEDVLLCGRTTLGGSATIGDRTMVGGAVVINDQASVGKDVKIAGGAIVLDEIEDGQAVLGVPAMPARLALANIAAQRNIASFCRKVEKSLKKLDPDFKPPST